jgi:hypothetical protein
LGNAANFNCDTVIRSYPGDRLKPEESVLGEVAQTLDKK